MMNINLYPFKDREEHVPEELDSTVFVVNNHGVIFSLKHEDTIDSLPGLATGYMYLKRALYESLRQSPKGPTTPFHLLDYCSVL